MAQDKSTSGRKVKVDSETDSASANASALASHAGTRARDKDPAQLSDTEKRVDHIAKLMCEGGWQTGETAARLAKDWGLALNTVEGLACEASRTVRLMFRWLDDKQAVRDYALQAFHRIAVKGEQEGSTKGLAVALDGIRTLAEYTGNKPSSKLEVEIKPPAEQWASIKDWLKEPDDELLAALTECGWVRREVVGGEP